MTISDLLNATSLPGTEAFSVFEGPQYGLRYGGVAFAVPEPSTWALLMIGFGGLGVSLRSRRRGAAVA